jgi:3-oxoacyl-[acyl-carrier protein] reductase
VTAAEVSVVTGASGGIGTGIVRALLERGDRVVAVDISADALERLRADIGKTEGRLIGVVADVADERDWDRVRDEASAEFGAPTVLVNNAGISPKHDGRKLQGVDIPLVEWDAVVAVNLTGPFLGIRALAPGMIEAGHGRIVNMSSVAARYGGRLGAVHYAATKTGLLGITRAFAHELASSGITVNAIAAGRIGTGMAAMVSDDVNRDYASTVPVGRLGTAEDIAHAVRYLTDPASGFVTGITLDVNGGSHMQ